jgi:hypothetical protein
MALSIAGGIQPTTDQNGLKALRTTEKQNTI